MKESLTDPLYFPVVTRSLRATDLQAFVKLLH